MACRMASTGSPGKIQISELTGNTLKEKFPSFLLEERGMIDVKVGYQLITWFLSVIEKSYQLQSCREFHKDQLYS